MLSNVNHYYLVVYTDDNSKQYITPYLENPNIKMVIKSYEEFHMYKYCNHWIENHSVNSLLKDRIDWKINMLWSEKIFFVKHTIDHKLFITDYYGWCDIGYFRGRQNDLTIEQLQTWPSNSKISLLDHNKIYYACVNNNTAYMNQLCNLIQNKNTEGVPIQPIPENQTSVAGGFFICHGSNIQWWANTYDSKLSTYFANHYLVKDDQIILIDCIFSNLSRFCLCSENIAIYDNWFLFQRFLSS
jgi:hypothetical protein